MPANINDLNRRLRTRAPGLTLVKNGLYAEIVASDPGGRETDITAAGLQTQTVLRAQLNRLVADLSKYTEASIKLCVLETIEILINTTPIDTTWAAHSWFPSYGQISDNGGYLVEPGDEADSTGVVESFEDFSSYDDLGEDPAAAFLREHDPDFSDSGSGAGEIITIEQDFKLQERKANQEAAINSFARRDILIGDRLVAIPQFSNNVPYIGELNEGKSRQTPRNFVGRAILVGLTRLELRANVIAGA